MATRSRDPAGAATLIARHADVTAVDRRRRLPVRLCRPGVAGRPRGRGPAARVVDRRTPREGPAGGHVRGASTCRSGSGHVPMGRWRVPRTLGHRRRVGPGSFRFCLRCGVTYEAMRSAELAKLVTLDKEGRSSAMTVIASSIVSAPARTAARPNLTQRRANC